MHCRITRKGSRGNYRKRWIDNIIGDAEKLHHLILRHRPHQTADIYVERHGDNDLIVGEELLTAREPTKEEKKSLIQRSA